MAGAGASQTGSGSHQPTGFSEASSAIGIASPGSAGKVFPAPRLRPVKRGRVCGRDGNTQPPPAEGETRFYFSAVSTVEGVRSSGSTTGSELPGL
jgi:hypothetical protein